MLKKFVPEGESRFFAVLMPVVLLLAALAWHNRFIQDDAFISFRYARNFVEGHGLVWNIGEPVEGYTNFLWVMLVSGALRLGIEPIGFTYGAGIICFVFSLIFAFKIAEIVLHSRNWALLAVALLGTNYTFSSYATGGLETQLQACLVTCAAYLVVASLSAGHWSTSRLAALSAVSTSALLTRMDSAVVVFICASVAGLGVIRGGKVCPPP